MVADVRVFKPDQAITPAGRVGYWAADLWAALRETGKQLTVKRFLVTANGGKFRHAVAGTVGPDVVARDAPAGGTVRRARAERRHGDFLAEPYRCGATINLTGERLTGTK